MINAPIPKNPNNLRSSVIKQKLYNAWKNEAANKPVMLSTNLFSLVLAIPTKNPIITAKNRFANTTVMAYKKSISV